MAAVDRSMAVAGSACLVAVPILAVVASAADHTFAAVVVAAWRVAAVYVLAVEVAADIDSALASVPAKAAEVASDQKAARILAVALRPLAEAAPVASAAAQILAASVAVAH